MSTRVLLLLALSVCMAFAQNAVSGGSRGQCLCRRVRDRFGPPRAILDIQIYPPSPSCDNMEIVVSLKNGVQYCLNPGMKKVQNMIRNMQAVKKEVPTASPEGSTDLWAPI
ncbi:hypothetical protein AAFF_G00319720 [Aldrovandia affinis]|uniref:Chemokine interleukin-8-like domain-containing protein n=1 Tax=Aldrovandia affinis TaxID=143900 RepID=A0AAD7SMW7_9TELE|nr:hypothetical protein AAFF_G00319720 [Aldrovandia affinis]